jgi:hypothetical protein
MSTGVRAIVSHAQVDRFLVVHPHPAVLAILAERATAVLENAWRAMKAIIARQVPP